MEEDEDEDEWLAWNPATFAANNGHQVPQHPGNPQDHVDLNLSGSSMRFLRGDGPDSSLDQVFDNAEADDGSSSSSDPTSSLLEDHARFDAAQSRCANILIFGRKGMPADVFTRGSSSANQPEPVIIAREVLQPVLAAAPTPAPTSLEIVPWKPVPQVLALQLWPAIVESRSAAEAQATSAPVILLGDVPRAEHQGPKESGPSDFEFHATQIQPSPVTQRKRRNYGSNMSLPISIGSMDTPLVDSTVRRSTRPSSARDGFHEVRVDKEPSKKRKGNVILIMVSFIGRNLLIFLIYYFYP